MGGKDVWNYHHTFANIKIQKCKRFGNVPRGTKDISESLAFLQSEIHAKGSIDAIRRLREGLDDLMKYEDLWGSQHGSRNGTTTPKFFTKKRPKEEIEIGLTPLKMKMIGLFLMATILGRYFSNFYSYIFASNNPSTTEDVTTMVKGGYLYHCQSIETFAYSWLGWLTSSFLPKLLRGG